MILNRNTVLLEAGCTQVHYHAGKLEAPSLIEGLLAGSTAALEEAYDRYHRPLRAFTRRLLGDHAVAEDLVQETFLAHFRTIPRYDCTYSLKTFLMSIAANHARHHIRTAARRRAVLSRFHQVPRPPASTPEEEVRGGQFNHLLFDLLDKLPTEQRIAFVLCEVEERTSAEAAVIMGTSQATVRTRLWYAKRKLRQALARGDFR